MLSVHSDGALGSDDSRKKYFAGACNRFSRMKFTDTHLHTENIRPPACTKKRVHFRESSESAKRVHFEDSSNSPKRVHFEKSSDYPNRVRFRESQTDRPTNRQTNNQADTQTG